MKERFYAPQIVSLRIESNRRRAPFSTQQSARFMCGLVSLILLEPGGYRTHSLHCTTATLSYRRRKSLRSV